MIGLFIARRDNGSWITDGKARIGLCITCIAACKDLIAAGSWEVIWRSVDGGQTWSEADNNLAIRYIRWLCRQTESLGKHGWRASTGIISRHS